MKKILIYFLLFSPFLFSCEEEQDVAPIESLFFGNGEGGSTIQKPVEKDSLSLLTANASQITDKSARVGLQITNFLIADSTEKVEIGIQYGLKSAGFTTRTSIARIIPERLYTKYETLSSLRANSEYIYRAYGRKLDGSLEAYGPTKSFTTLSEPFRANTYGGATYQNLISDDFSDNSNNWIEASNSSYRFKVENGYYHCQSKNNQYWFVGQSFNMDESRNYEIEARIKFVNGSNNARYGILWNARDLNNGYYFNLTNNRQFTVGETKGNGSFNLINWIGWQSDNNILQNNWNRMTIRKYGNTFYFFINKVMVRTRPFVAEKGHQQLFMNGPNTTFHADDFRISYITN